MKQANTARATLGLLALTLVIGLVGCAEPSTNSPGSGANEVPDAPTVQAIDPAYVLKQASSPVPAPPKSLVDAACAEGAVVWYDGAPEENGKAILEAFQKEYPCIKSAQQVRVIGAASATRVIQEAEAKVDGADLMTNGPDKVWELAQRGLVLETDWKKYGVPEEFAPGNSGIATGASVLVLMYNTDLIEKADAPKGWDDLLDAKWAGNQIGIWSQPSAFMDVVPAWGVDYTEKYLTALMAQGPRLYESTFPLSQAIGAGETPIGLVYYHAAQPTVDSGAPVSERIALDPQPVTIQYGVVPTPAVHPNAGRLLALWMSGEKGAAIYDKYTSAGNVLIPTTTQGKLLKNTVMVGYTPLNGGERAASGAIFQKIISGE